MWHVWNMLEMNLDAAITLLTGIVSVLVKVIGLPGQIKSNYTRKSTEGLSDWFVISAFLSYLLWTIHGVLQHDWALIIGQGPGVLTTGVILWQIWLYRGARAKTKHSRFTWVLLPGILAPRGRGEFQAVSQLKRDRER
jgi:MtN3 and saliva related transmembrane protein